jgi:hypothetical protein
MTVDPRFERLFGQVELVRGAGNRKRSQLCIMSFAAFLAGERHTDDPTTASLLVRRFAMIVNDEMPYRLRQRLKAFAPRILGTRDGQDLARARLLAEAARSELLPRIVSDFGHASEHMLRLPGTSTPLPKLWENLIHIASNECDGGRLKAGEEIAAATAILITRCSRAATTPTDQEWYWLKAIDLLDRLCDVGVGVDRVSISVDQVVAMSTFLAQCSETQQRRARFVAAIVRVCNLVPAPLR